jgi:hypothetical protein
MNGIEFKYSETTTNHKGKTVYEWIECTIHRKDRDIPTTIRENFSEVLRNVTYFTPWDTHPFRMHRHKTLIQCARIAFGFSGLYDQDEAFRIIDSSDDPRVYEGDETDGNVDSVKTHDLVLMAIKKNNSKRMLEIYESLSNEEKLALNSSLNSAQRARLKKLLGGDYCGI